MTVAECAQRAAVALVEAGAAPDDARRDVAVLLRHLLAWDGATWVSRQRDPIPTAATVALDTLIARRATGEPVAYLTGTREFYGRDFAVTGAVLIPRPETELLVEEALAAVDARGATTPVVVDVGTGSGCIAVTLAAERPSIQMIATDTSASALSVAAGNVRRHGVADRVHLRSGTSTAGARDVDVVVSNPPYIALAERDGLMRDVRDFEPAAALFAGRDGLDVIRDIIPDAARALRPGGRLLLEIGATQADAVCRLLSAEGFEAIAVRADLAGRPRLVGGRRAGAASV